MMYNIVLARFLADSEQSVVNSSIFIHLGNDYSCGV